MKVIDGWLVGWDAGEWGGTVWWYSPDWSDKYEVSSDQVFNFFPSGKGFLAPSGVAHLNLSVGWVVRFTRAANRWRSQRVLELGSAPSGACADRKGGVLVVTQNKLVRVNHLGELDEVIRDAFWKNWNARPTSIAVDEANSVYVAMPGGVLRVDATKRATWLVPDKSWAPN